MDLIIKAAFIVSTVPQFSFYQTSLAKDRASEFDPGKERRVRPKITSCENGLLSTESLYYFCFGQK